MGKNLTEKEAADMLNMSVHWMRKMRVIGGGPIFIKMGGSIRYPLEELTAFRESCKRHSTSDQAKACA